MCYSCENPSPAGMELKNRALIISCKELQTLKPISVAGVDKVIIRGCSKLQCIENIPDRVEDLVIAYCPLLVHSPTIPESVLSLTISDCPSMKSLPILPSLLMHLFVDEMDGLEFIPMLPENLEQLTVTNCRSIKSLPIQSSHRLELLDCSNSVSLEYLPDISSVQFLHIYNCPSLKRIEKKAEQFQSIYCWNCPMLITTFAQKVCKTKSPYINIEKSLEKKIVDLQVAFRKKLIQRKITLRCCLKTIPFDIKEYLMEFV